MSSEPMTMGQQAVKGPTVMDHLDKSLGEYEGLLDMLQAALSDVLRGDTPSEAPDSPPPSTQFEQLVDALDRRNDRLRRILQRLAV